MLQNCFHSGAFSAKTTAVSLLQLMQQSEHAYIMMSLCQRDQLEHNTVGHMHAARTRYRTHIVVSTVATAVVQSAPSAAGQGQYLNVASK